MTWVQFLSIACFAVALALFVAALVNCFEWYKRSRQPQVQHAERVEEVAAEDVDDTDGAGSISVTYDPSDPPVQMTLNEGSTKTYLCTCHGRAIQPGETVVMWPMGKGAPASAKHLFCSDAMKSLAVDTNG